MTETHEKLYDILLDIRNEMGSHTAKLDGIEKKQEQLTKYQEYANSKTAKNITDIASLQQTLADYPEIKEKIADVLTTKKAVIMIGGILVVVGGTFWGITKYAFKAYLKDNLGTVLQESGYDTIQIKEELNN